MSLISGFSPANLLYTFCLSLSHCARCGWNQMRMAKITSLRIILKTRLFRTFLGLARANSDILFLSRASTSKCQRQTHFCWWFKQPSSKLVLRLLWERERSASSDFNFGEGKSTLRRYSANRKADRWSWRLHCHKRSLIEAAMRTELLSHCWNSSWDKNSDLFG